MKKLFAVSALLFVAFSAGAVISAQEPAEQTAPAATAASDVTGTWAGTMQGPNGDFTVTFHLKQNAGKLTGTVDSPMGGEPIEIENGKIDGNKVYWETDFNGMTIQHEGTVTGDEMKINVKSSDGQLPAMDITLKRAKA